MNLLIQLRKGMAALCMVSLLAGGVSAQDATSLEDGLEQEIVSKSFAMEMKKQAMKDIALSSRREERRMRDEIRVAAKSGDKVTAGKLREKLKIIHKENVAKKKQSREALKGAKREVKGDTEKAKKARRSQ